jgi:hypothetical protein
MFAAEGNCATTVPSRRRQVGTAHMHVQRLLEWFDRRLQVELHDVVKLFVSGNTGRLLTVVGVSLRPLASYMSAQNPQHFVEGICSSRRPQQATERRFLAKDRRIRVGG